VRLILLLSAVLAGWTVQAGTTTIRIETEEGGNVVTGGSVVNTKGTVFWNGSSWVSNDTAAHMYFVSVDTGVRLRDYTTVTVQGNTPGVMAGTPGHTVVRSLYSYEKTVTGGVYRFQAAQYQVTATDRTSGITDIILRSRGTAQGTSGAFFDVYLARPDGSGVTAVRGDPVWFDYLGTSLAAALTQTSATASKSGEFPTAGANYWLDVSGGADMGGKTLQLRTGALTPAHDALGWGGAFTLAASVKFMESSELKEIRFLPWAEGTFQATTTPPSGVPVPPTMWLALTGLAGAGVAEWRRRRRQ